MLAWQHLDPLRNVEASAALGRKWHNRGYHGTLHHDVGAVYTKELGMWDGDPVSLHPHTPADSARRYVNLIRADQIMAEGQRAFDAADYRWAAEILHKLVFADPGNTAARELQADSYEQMGYQAEGPQWRGIFLTAARELREGALPASFATASPDTILAMPIDILFDFAAVHVIGDWTVWVNRGVLNARRGASPDTHLTVAGPKAALVGVVLQPASAGQLAQARKIQLDGDESVLDSFAGLIDDFDPDFNIVTP